LANIQKEKRSSKEIKKTPEGLYTINDKNPHSEFHLNLGISYPNEEDIKDAERLNKKPGGLSEIEELYENVPIGTVIEIRK
jgi:hypothetical protein